jgi:glycosyltransferase involved in cell wall biosynthesis
MNILIVGNRVPWPVRDGGAMATYQLLKSLNFEGCNVTYFTLNTKKHWVSQKQIQESLPFVNVMAVPHLVTISAIDAFKNLFISNSYFLSRYHNQKAKEQLEILLKNNNYDTVIIEGLYSSVFLRTIRQYFNKSVVYRAHNLEHQIWSRLIKTESNVLKKWYLNIQVQRLKNEEVQFIQNVDKCVSISPEDQKAFIQIQSQTNSNISQTNNNSKLDALTVKRNFLYLPGMDPGLMEKSKLQPDSLFHLASMEWDANVAGLEWFLSKVWPLVLSKQPQMSIHIGGKSLKKSDKRYFQSRLINHGEVDDATEFMKHHGIGIVPLWAGSGLRMKLLQAMSLGVPCVSTSVGAQGLNVENGRELLIADNPAEFAEALLKLNTDRKFAIEIGKNALNYVIEHHNSVHNTRALIQFLKTNE